MTKRRIRIQRGAKSKARDPFLPADVDPRDPEIVRAKHRLYASGRARRND